jgi:murein DD-endopeptidase MepM/ murein hydrolase activator NlpD
LALSGAAIGALVILAGAGAAGLYGTGDRDRVVAENLALRAQLDVAEHALDEAAPILRRVRAYDEELRDLARRQALPGFGPLDEDAMAEREAWLDGVAGTVHEPAEDDALAQAEDVVKRASAIRDEARELEGHLADLDKSLDRLTALSDGLPTMWPVEGGVITSGFGYRLNPFGHREWKFHGGIDIGEPYGTPVYATNAGIITFADWDSGHGQMVVVDHGNDISTRYCHLSSILTAVGDDVGDGDLVGLVGSTGMSTGPHLHYEIWFGDERADPLQYLPAR